MIADLEGFDPGSDLFDDAGPLVAKHHRQLWIGPGAVGRVETTVANATGDHSNQDFAVLGIR